MFQKIAKHRANDASNDVHRPPLATNDGFNIFPNIKFETDSPAKQLLPDLAETI